MYEFYVFIHIVTFILAVVFLVFGLYKRAEVEEYKVPLFVGIALAVLFIAGIVSMNTMDRKEELKVVTPIITENDTHEKHWQITLDGEKYSGKSFVVMINAAESEQGMYMSYHTYLGAKHDFALYITKEFNDKYQIIKLR
jgi:hypothetical protein